MIDNFRKFITLAASRSFAKAADQLHTTQSTLSRHMAELERYLGFKLFDRNPLKLTEAGSHCLQVVSPVISAYDKAVEESREFAPISQFISHSHHAIISTRETTEGSNNAKRCQAHEKGLRPGTFAVVRDEAAQQNHRVRRN